MAYIELLANRILQVFKEEEMKSEIRNLKLEIQIIVEFPFGNGRYIY